jgi:hypothetical protein
MRADQVPGRASFVTRPEAALERLRRRSHGLFTGNESAQAKTITVFIARKLIQTPSRTGRGSEKARRNPKSGRNDRPARTGH